MNPEICDIILVIADTQQNIQEGQRNLREEKRKLLDLIASDAFLCKPEFLTVNIQALTRYLNTKG